MGAHRNEVSVGNLSAMHPCQSSALRRSVWGSKPMSCTEGDYSPPFSRKLRANYTLACHLAGYFCFLHRNKLLTLSTEAVLGCTTLPSAHKATRRNLIVSGGCKNSLQARVDRPLSLHQRPVQTENRLCFTSDLLQVLSSFQCPEFDRSELWIVRSTASGALCVAHTLLVLQSRAGVSPSSNRQVQPSWWLL